MIDYSLLSPFPLSTEKTNKSRTWKLRSLFYSVDLTEDCSPGTASQIALRDCSKKVREELGDAGVFAGEKARVVEHPKITADH